MFQSCDSKMSFYVENIFSMFLIIIFQSRSWISRKYFAAGLRDWSEMAPMAVPSNGIPLGVPISNHEYDMTDADSFNQKGLYSVGANPPPALSQRE